MHALDRFSNPAAGGAKVRIEPSSLATYEDGKLTPRRTGTGRIVASDGRVTTSEKLEVVSKLQSLTVSPDQADLDNGATQQLSLSGTVKGGDAVRIPAEAATWKVTPDNLGTVDAHGLFTSDTEHGGLAEVSATVVSTTTTTSIAVGRVTQVVDPMTSTDIWRLSNNTTGKPSHAERGPGRRPAGVHRVRFAAPRLHDAGWRGRQAARAGAEGHAEDRHPRRSGPHRHRCVDQGRRPRRPPARREVHQRRRHGQHPLYLTGVTSDGWRLAVAQLPRA
ncbi:hypothetical protein ACFQ51_48590 [Streptomyces kaempferi]